MPCMSAGWAELYFYLHKINRVFVLCDLSLTELAAGTKIGESVNLLVGRQWPHWSLCCPHSRLLVTTGSQTLASPHLCAFIHPPTPGRQFFWPSSAHFTSNYSAWMNLSFLEVIEYSLVTRKCTLLYESSAKDLQWGLKMVSRTHWTGNILAFQGFGGKRTAEERIEHPSTSSHFSLNRKCKNLNSLVEFLVRK